MILQIFFQKVKFFFWIARGGVYYARKLGAKVGEDCRIYTTRFGSEPWMITIGNKVTITSGVTFLTHDGSAWLFSDEKGRRYLYRPIEIKNNVFVGVNSIIMPGVHIEDNVIVAAGSVVTKSVPTNSIVAGNPAKIIGHFNQLRDRALMDFFSDDKMDRSKSYKERIKQAIDYNQKEYLK